MNFLKTNKNEDFSRHFSLSILRGFSLDGKLPKLSNNFSLWLHFVYPLFVYFNGFFFNADKLHLAFLILFKLPTKTTQQIFNHQVNISSFHPSTSLVINETQVNVSSCCEWIKHFANKVAERVIYGFSDEKINFHLGSHAFSNMKWGKKARAPLRQ